MVLAPCVRGVSVVLNILPPEFQSCILEKFLIDYSLGHGIAFAHVSLGGLLSHHFLRQFRIYQILNGMIPPIQLERMLQSAVLVLC